MYSVCSKDVFEALPVTVDNETTPPQLVKSSHTSSDSVEEMERRFEKVNIQTLLLLSLFSLYQSLSLTLRLLRLFSPLKMRRLLSNLLTLRNFHYLYPVLQRWNNGCIRILRETHKVSFSLSLSSTNSVFIGPFSSQEMNSWFTAGYFTMSLNVRRVCDTIMLPLGN